MPPIIHTSEPRHHAVNHHLRLRAVLHRRAPASRLAIAGRARLVVARTGRQRRATRRRAARRPDLGALAGRCVVAASFSLDASLAGWAHGLLHRHLRFLLVAPRAARSAVALARLSPDPPQPAAPGSQHLVLQAPGRNARQLADRQPAGLCRARPRPRGRRHLHPVYCAGRVLHSHQPAHAALGRLCLPAAGDAPHPPPARPPPQQLRRHRLVGHAVRQLREPARLAGALRLRRCA